MLTRIGDLLDRPSLEAVTETLSDPALFEAGAASAAGRARQVKRNLQAKMGDIKVKGVAGMIETAILGNDVFQSAARPKRLARLVISRYETGMEYGPHIDAPMIDGVRTDVSFTLFLSDPRSYDGGELIIDTGGGEEVVKLPAGSMVCYPSCYLHRVAPVTKGVRLAALGWVQSHIRAEDRRDLLFAFDSALARLASGSAEGPVLDELANIRANLMRMWMDD